MGMHEFMHHKYGQYGGPKPEFGHGGFDHMGFGYGREMDPEEDF